jgi:hypothetical protein
MTPYHYAIVQVRDAAVASERRNVGLVVLCPAQGKAWVRQADLKQRAHLFGEESAFVRALLDVLADEAEEVARCGSASVAHGWLRARTLPTEDALALAEPAVGITANLEAEVRRLRVRYLGPPGRGGTTVAERVRKQALRELSIVASPRAFQSGPATWRFPAVADLASGPVVVNALTFEQRNPEGLLNAVFQNIGRAGEVRVHHPALRWLTIADGPRSGAGGAAFDRALQLMQASGLHPIRPEPAEVQASLVRLQGPVDARVGDA